MAFNNIDDELRSVVGMAGAVRVLPDTIGPFDDQDMVGLVLYSGLVFGEVEPSLFKEFVPFTVLLKRSPVESMIIKRTVSEDVER